MKTLSTALSVAGLIAAGLGNAPQAQTPPAAPASNPAAGNPGSQAEATRALLMRLAAIDVSDAAFRKLDTDHDGRISALEANANPKVAARFLEADKNHDGFLSLEEFRSLGNPSPPAPDPDDTSAAPR